MQRLVSAVVLAAVLGSASGEALANPFARAWHSFCHDYRMNRDWPYQYVEADRAAAKAPFAQLMANGWRKQHTLGDQYFFEDTNELTEAGRLKVHFILTVAPIHRRTIYVFDNRSGDEVLTGRLQAVHTYAAQILPPGHAADVETTVIPDFGSPAEYIDSVGRKYRDTTPDPRLPEAQMGAY